MVRLIKKILKKQKELNGFKKKNNCKEINNTKS